MPGQAAATSEVREHNLDRRSRALSHSQSVRFNYQAHPQLDLHNPSAGVSSSGHPVVLLKDRREGHEDLCDRSVNEGSPSSPSMNPAAAYGGR